MTFSTARYVCKFAAKLKPFNARRFFKTAAWNGSARGILLERKHYGESVWNESSLQRNLKKPWNAQENAIYEWGWGGSEGIAAFRLIPPLSSVPHHVPPINKLSKFEGANNWRRQVAFRNWKFSLIWNFVAHVSVHFFSTILGHPRSF